MAALSAETQRKTRSLHLAERGNAAVKTGEIVYKGSLISVVESTGRVTCTAKTTGTAFVGVALETATGNTAGTTKVDYLYGHVELITAKAALTTTYRMCNVALEDDNTVTTLSDAGTAAVRQIAGMAVDFDSAGDAWVWIGHFSQKDAP